MAEAVHFGRYVLDRRLGVGPAVELLLGQVMSGEGIRKPVLIKRLLPDRGSDQESVTKLVDEARLGACLVHPTLIELYELGEADGVGFVALEYLEGVDLEQLISQCATQERPIPLEIVLHLIADAAEGLAFAHAAKDDEGRPLKVLHGNMSPTSLVITARGGTKVVDFVLARPGVGVVAAPSFKGKACYLSPEQLRGEDATVRSDVFSLGAVFYELLTLRPCFKGATPEETVAAARAGTAGNIMALRPDLSAKTESLLRSMLDPDPKLRCPGAASVAEFLRRQLAERSRPSADDIAAHFASIMEATVRVGCQFHTLLADISMPVSEDLADPAIEVTSDAYRRLCSNSSPGGTAIDVVLPRPDAAEPSPVVSAPVETTLVVGLPTGPECTARTDRPVAAQARGGWRPVAPAGRSSALMLGAVVVLGFLLAGLAIVVVRYHWAPLARSTVVPLPPGAVPPPR
jgi:serine/threonine protein kinase